MIKNIIIGQLLSLLGGFFNKILDYAKEVAERNHEDRHNPVVVGWYSFVYLAAYGLGALAARIFWLTLPPQDIIIGVFFFLPVFVLGAMLGGSLLYLAGRRLTDQSRIILGSVVTAVLLIGLGGQILLWGFELWDQNQPTNKINMVQAAQPLEALPLVYAEVIPPMLAYERTADTLRVTNLSDAGLTVQLTLALPQGVLMQRCHARLETLVCPGEACPPLSGENASATASVSSLAPLLGAGQTGLYKTDHCDEGFAEAKPEFRVFSVDEDRFLFKSETTLIPDIH
jgi:hypothetical protein